MIYQLLTTSLHRECSKVQPDLANLRRLIAPDNVNKKDCFGYTPLMRTVNLEAIALLLQNSADPNLKYNNRPLLVIILQNIKKKNLLANFNFERLVQLFLQSSVNLLEIDPVTKLPLFNYILSYHWNRSTPSQSYIDQNVYRMILDVMIRNEVNKNTIIIFIIQYCYWKKYYHCLNDNDLILLTRTFQHLRLITNNDLLIRLINLYEGQTVIFDIIKSLITMGININYQDSTGLTPLMVACLIYQRDYQLIQELVVNGANVNAVYKEHTPLMYLIRELPDNQPELIYLLIKHGADINIFINNYNALILAIYYHKFELAKVLIQSGAIINQKVLSILTPLQAFELIKIAKIHNASLDGQINDLCQLDTRLTRAQAFQIVKKKYWYLYQSENLANYLDLLDDLAKYRKNDDTLYGEEWSDIIDPVIYSNNYWFTQTELEQLKTNICPYTRTKLGEPVLNLQTIIQNTKIER